MLQLRRALQLFTAFRNVPEEKSLHGSSADQISARADSAYWQRGTVRADCVLLHARPCSSRNQGTGHRVESQTIRQDCQATSGLSCTHGVRNTRTLNNPVRAGIVERAEQYPF